MERIVSFNVDHRFIEPGIYISRVDGDVTTYDLRTRRPNTGVMSNAEMHSTEHLFATFIRNSSLKNDILYFGPMGCQTGYYLLVRNADHPTVVAAVQETLGRIMAYEGLMPGKSETECGNYINLSVDAAKDGCGPYLEAIKGWTTEQLSYNANLRSVST